MSAARDAEFRAMAAPSVPRFEDRNLVGICHLDVVDVDDVLSVGDEIRGNVADTVVLKEGKSWSRVYLDDDGGSLVETWKQDGGVQHSEAVISGAIAKDRLALMPHLWRMKGRRYLVVTTNRNGDQLLMGRPETPATASVPLRRTGDGDNMERDRNEYRVVFSLARRLPVPFYGGEAPDPTPVGCPTLEQQIALVDWAAIEALLSEGQLAAAVTSLCETCPTLAVLIAAEEWAAIEALLDSEQLTAAEASLCSTLCELMDAAFVSTPGDPGIDVVLDGVAGFIPETATYLGKPQGFLANWNGSGFDAEYYWTGSNWLVTDGTTNWTSTEDVATPGLVTTWTGSPTPTVDDAAGATLDASAIVDCWDSEQLEAVQALVCETAANGRAMTTDGTTPVITVPPGTDVPLPQSTILIKNASNADAEIAASNTLFSSGALKATTRIPRRELFYVGGAATGLYATADRLVADTIPQVPIPASPANHLHEYTAGDTWTKPANLKELWVLCVGGGGGGGSARLTSGATVGGGGGGGQGGYLVWRRIPASALGPTETITIGAGGAGAAGIATTAGNGATGTTGGSTSFGSLVVARGGNGGMGGATTNGGNNWSTTLVGCTPAYVPYASLGAGGGEQRISVAAGSFPGHGLQNSIGVGQASPIYSNRGCAGGAYGGGLTGGTTPYAASTGGGLFVQGVLSALPAANANGANAVAKDILFMTSLVPTNGLGTGGGGGSAAATGNGTTGGNGGNYGAGGGGGGSAIAPNTSGAGGTGGGGLCLIVEILEAI